MRVLAKSRAKVTGIEVLCTLFEITLYSMSTRLSRHLQACKGFVLNDNTLNLPVVARQPHPDPSYALVLATQ